MEAVDPADGISGGGFRSDCDAFVSITPSVSPSLIPSVDPSSLPSMTPSSNPSSCPLELTDWNQFGNSIYGSESFSRAGKSVSISFDGLTIAVGENDHTNGNNSGKVRIYAWNGELWTQLGSDLRGEREGDQFGDSISLSSDGRTIAVGARGNDDGGDTAGHVRVHSFNGSNWTQVGANINGSTYDNSGVAVSLSSDGTVVAVGAPGHNNAAGCVRVYKWNGTAWMQRGANIEGEFINDNSGHSVALSADGQSVVIGSPHSDLNGDGSGHISVYSWDGSGWNQIGTNIIGANSADASGYSVSISCDGKTVAYGAVNSDAGHVSVYSWNGITWNKDGSSITGETSGDGFGASVSLSCDGRTVAAGSTMNSGGGSSAGHVRIFRWDKEIWRQLGTDIDGDTSYEQSGYSVSLSSDGTRVIIGAHYNSDIDTYAGVARVFSICVDQLPPSSVPPSSSPSMLPSSLPSFSDSPSLSAGPSCTPSTFVIPASTCPTSSTSYVQQSKLSPSESDGAFSYDDGVDIGDGIAVVGAKFGTGNEFASGAAYIFERDGNGDWSETQKLIASDGIGGSHFGVSVGISGDYAVIGANTGGYCDPDALDPMSQCSGAAYVFQKDASGNWEETVKLVAPDGEGGNDFGISVDISESGDYIIVGAFGDNSNIGAAYIFEKDEGGSWAFKTKLLSSDSSENDHFGFAVSISGAHAVVSAPWKDNGTGAVYVFKKDECNGNWEQMSKLLSDRESGGTFGWSVDLSGNKMIVGTALGGGGSDGTAYIFELDDSNIWTEKVKLSGTNNYGRNVGISDCVAIVGTHSGNAFIIKRDDNTDTWVQTNSLDGGFSFGHTVGVYGSDIIVGQTSVDAAYIYVQT